LVIEMSLYYDARSKKHKQNKVLCLLSTFGSATCTHCPHLNLTALQTQ